VASWYAIALVRLTEEKENGNFTKTAICVFNFAHTLLITFFPFVCCTFSEDMAPSFQFCFFLQKHKRVIFSLLVVCRFICVIIEKLMCFLLHVAGTLLFPYFQHNFILSRQQMASICRIPFHDSVVKTYKGLYFRTQIKQCNSYTVNKCTPQGHSSPHNPYLFEPLESVILLTPKPTMGIPPVGTNIFLLVSFPLFVISFGVGRVGWYPSLVSKKTYTLFPTARASPVAWSPSGLPRETPFPTSCKKMLRNNANFQLWKNTVTSLRLQ